MNVRSIQLALKSLGFEPGTIDGIWGRNTSTAVREFQVNKGLTPTGIVDPQTEQAIARAGGTLPDTSALVWFEEARRLMGTKEVAGPASNPVILDWAKNLDLNYPDDDIPWCGLFVGHCIAATLPHEPLLSNPLGARNWSKFGKQVDPMLGAVLVFWRKSRESGLGHVGFYDGEDDESFHVLGGNQSDAVNVARVGKDRLVGARWPTSASGISSVRVQQSRTGGLSTNEA
jgi:uncharacterized protein (TIGR02594 family)